LKSFYSDEENVKITSASARINKRRWTVLTQKLIPIKKRYLAQVCFFRIIISMLQFLHNKKLFNEFYQKGGILQFLYPGLLSIKFKYEG